MRINRSLITFLPDTGAGSGTVTSVALSATVPTGLSASVSGSPITSAGTLGLTLSFAAGYAIPTTIKQSNWDDAYSFVTGFPVGTEGQLLRFDAFGDLEAFTANYLSNPMTQMGDMIRGNAVGLPIRLPGNPTSTLMYLTSEGDGTTPFPPYWSAITAAAIGAVPSTRQLTINGTTQDLSANRTFNVGTVTSVALSVPSAFSVSGSPITGSGTLAITGAGTASQYVRGDGQLATLPTGGSGGSSVSYYLNGGTAASVGTYYQMSTNAVVGVNADFTRTGNGLICQFLTDAGDPNRLQIPAGNWNFEMFFSMSSSGGTPEFYVELLKYDGTTFTSIASSSAIPEVISGGTTIDLYLTSLAIPATTLLATDRLALRVYIVNNSGGRTATLHTQDSHLCQIITNFAGGVSALNGLTANTQYLAVGTSGSDFNISSVTDTHTFNLPSASASVRGALLSADWSTFNAKMNNPFSQVGQMVYSNAAGIPLVVAPNITTTKKFLAMTGSGTTGAAPQWSDISSSISTSFQIDYDSAVVGSRNSINNVFSVSSNFISGTTRVFVNGLRYSNGASYDYTETATNQITFTNPPDAGDLIIIEYVKL